MYDWESLRGYGYGDLMRQMTDVPASYGLGSVGEFGWDGWLGTFFSNEPAHGITLVFGVQQVGVGRTGILIRQIKNIVMSELT